jgi:uncharacterized protein (DUF1330 family)
MKKIVLCLTLLCLLGGLSVIFAQKPSSVIHVINVKWKADAKPEQIQAALNMAHELPKKFPGIKRVWTKNIKFQMKPNFDQAIVMEFESEDALKKYADSPAQKEWYKVYLPIREESRTNDITN